MAAACYDRGQVLKPAGASLIPDYTHCELGRESVLNIVAAAAAAAASSAVLCTPQPSPTSSILSPATTPTFKDYSQPLHVDCSVEYELPSSAKPPPSNGEPLLMIHPSYYRRAEAERRTTFVNNLPPRSSSSASSSRRSRKAPAITGMVVNPVMPVATAAIAASHRQLGPANGGSTLPSPSLATSTDLHTKPTSGAMAAAAAATYHAALTAALGSSAASHPEAKQQQHQQQADLDEKLQYFHGVSATLQRPTHFQAGATAGAGLLPPTYQGSGAQAPTYGMMAAPQRAHHLGSTAAPTIVTHHHPYRRTATASSRSAMKAAMSSALPTGSSTSAAYHPPSVYGMQRPQLVQQAFYEAPIYHHALLPQS